MDLKKDRFLREKGVLEIFPVSRSTWWAGVSSGKYPKPFKLGPKTTVWLESDILALIEGIKNKQEGTLDNA